MGDDTSTRTANKRGKRRNIQNPEKYHLNNTLTFESSFIYFTCISLLNKITALTLDEINCSVGGA